MDYELDKGFFESSKSFKKLDERLASITLKMLLRDVVGNAIQYGITRLGKNLQEVKK